MRILKILLSILIILVAIFVIGGFFIPAEWMVSRFTVIHTSAEKIYPYVSDFRQWEQWSPWNSSRDATLKYTYEGPDSGTGSRQTWTSEKMGTGWMQFTSAQPQTGVAYDLYIDMGKSPSSLHGEIAFTPATNDDTTVTWTDRGNSGNSFVKRWFSLLLKPMLGRDMDNGLARLKALAEKK